MHKTDDSRETLVTLLASVLSPNSALYAAGPLDHGKLYYEAIAQGRQDSLDVRATNQARLTAFVEQLRQQRSEAVIDPGLLQVKGWDSRALGDFFLEVIDRFVKESWFIDGWEFSHGATKEFIYCSHRAIPCFDQRGNRLFMSDAIELTRHAVTYAESMGLEAGKLEERLRTFEEEATKATDKRN